ncbi:DUF6308 family protein [Allokutzneria oryzae]|uniref:DUF6308 family protein n=1 Tax=Allokutzneria oryzae TaxID=1378989 RepID=A0ABV5ZRW8_9PSEU
MDGYGWAHRVLDDVVLGERAARDIRYYVETRAGRRYERLDEGTGLGEDADAFTAADVVATMALSLPWHGYSALSHLNACLDNLNAMLAEVPHTPMHEADAADYAPDGPADRMWQALTDLDGITPVIAGKLLARKRPHHVPVHDRLVLGVLGQPEDLWLCLHSWFAADPARAAGVAEVRERSGLCAASSLLRCVDIALWMYGKRLAPVLQVVPMP